MYFLYILYILEHKEHRIVLLLFIFSSIFKDNKYDNIIVIRPPFLISFVSVLDMTTLYKSYIFFLNLFICNKKNKKCEKHN